MQKTSYQKPEIRNSNDEIIQSGAYGKNTALSNPQNTGVIDYINNNLEWLNENKANASDVLLKSGGAVNGTVYLENGLYIRNINVGQNKQIAFAGNNFGSGNIGVIRGGRYSAGNTYIYLAVGDNDGNIDSTNTISLQRTENGEGVLALAPTPDVNSKNRSIATTAWVNGGNIVSSGNNYVRFGDGLQICYGTITVGTDGKGTWTFPVAFTSSPIVSLTDTGSNTVNIWRYKVSNVATETNGNKVTVYCVNASNAFASGSPRCIAIGRWK